MHARRHRGMLQGHASPRGRMSTGSTTTHQRADRHWAHLALAALSAFVFAACALHLRRGDLDPVAHPMSLYLIGDWGARYKKFVQPLQPFRIRGVIWRTSMMVSVTDIEFRLLSIAQAQPFYKVGLEGDVEDQEGENGQDGTGHDQAIFRVIFALYSRQTDDQCTNGISAQDN